MFEPIGDTARTTTGTGVCATIFPPAWSTANRYPDRRGPASPLATGLAPYHAAALPQQPSLRARIASQGTPQRRRRRLGLGESSMREGAPFPSSHGPPQIPRPASRTPHPRPRNHPYHSSVQDDAARFLL